MSAIFELSAIERSVLEQRAASLYVELQNCIRELNGIGERLRAGGIVPQLSAELNGWITLDPFDLRDPRNKLRIRTSWYRRPASRRGRDLWDLASASYCRAPDVLHSTAQGYVAVFNREGAAPLYINESMKELQATHGVCRFTAASLDALHEAFGTMSPAWATPSRKGPDDGQEYLMMTG